MLVPVGGKGIFPVPRKILAPFSNDEIDGFFPDYHHKTTISTRSFIFLPFSTRLSASKHLPGKHDIMATRHLKAAEPPPAGQHVSKTGDLPYMEHGLTDVH
jgi:hypothetical protein